MKKKKPLSMQ